MSALNNRQKLIIEMVEEEVSTNEYGNTQTKEKTKGLEEKLNLFLEKINQPILLNGLITNHREKV